MFLKYKLQRLSKKVIIPLLVLIYLILSFFSLHTKNIYHNGLHHLEPYKGGPFDDIKKIKCYAWYGHCNQIIEKSDIENGDVIWHKIDKYLDLNGDSPNSWALYHEYLYVHIPTKKRFNSPGRAIVDLAIGNPFSKDPPFYVVNDAQSRQGRPKSRLDITYNYNNWELRSNGIWAKYDKSNSEDAITNIMYLFGTDIIEPRNDWNLVIGDLHSKGTKLTVHRGSLNQVGDVMKKVPILVQKNDEFKVLQVSDLHFNSNFGVCKDQLNDEPGCKADPKTLNFIHQVLDLETPDLVVITGDVIDGFNTHDYQTAILKALSPFISRSIPFAIALGENDVSKDVPKQDIIKFITELPFSMMGNTDPKQHHNSISGDETNYALKIYDSKNDHLQNVIYILDIYSENSNQVEFLTQTYNSFPEKPKFSLEFQHYPIKEYRPKSAFAIVGTYNEKNKLKVKTEEKTRKILSDVNVQAMSVGYEHTNECCIHGEDKDQGLNSLWLCYGGATGEGGYGNTKIKYERRVRLFRMNTKNMEITSWKRKQTEPSSVFDYQYIYK